MVYKAHCGNILLNIYVQNWNIVIWVSKLGGFWGWATANPQKQPTTDCQFHHSGEATIIMVMSFAHASNGRILRLAAFFAAKWRSEKPENDSHENTQKKKLPKIMRTLKFSLKNWQLVSRPSSQSCESFRGVYGNTYYKVDEHSLPPWNQ